MTTMLVVKSLPLRGKLLLEENLFLLPLDNAFFIIGSVRVVGFNMIPFYRRIWTTTYVIIAWEEYGYEK